MTWILTRVCVGVEPRDYLLYVCNVWRSVAHCTMTTLLTTSPEYLYSVGSRLSA